VKKEGFICPNCGSTEAEFMTMVSSIPDGEDPWSSVLQVLTCAKCKRKIPAHLGERWNDRTVEEARSEWSETYRRRKRGRRDPSKSASGGAGSEHVRNLEQQVEAETIIQFARSLEGSEIFTLARGKGFMVNVASDGLEYTPSATGVRRKHGKKWLDRICQRFNRIGSFRVSDYRSLSANASYALAVISRYLDK
jgi:hypothetical protein